MYEIVVIQRTVNSSEPVGTLVKCNDENVEKTFDNITTVCEAAQRAGVLLNWSTITHYERYMRI